MSRSLLDLIARRRTTDSLSNLADWLDNKGSRREANKVSQFATDIAKVRRIATRSGGTTASVLDVIRSGIGDGGLDASVAALDRWSHGAIAADADDLAALSELAELQPDPAQFEAWLTEHLEAPANDSGVTLASIHAVKGREWPHVVLHHATSGLLPHRLSEDVEEERRVFHVGLTRCVESVTVVTGEPPSQFVAEMAGSDAPEGRAVAVGTAMGQAIGQGSTPRPSAPRSRGPAPPRDREAAGFSRAARRPAVTETVPAAVGFRFVRRGREYEVVGLDADGVKAVECGGRTSTTVRFGSTVDAPDASIVLGHPACAEGSERLRAWRFDRARATGKPAYTVFDDRTLRALAAALPTTERELAVIPGIGPVKLEAFGPELTAMFEELRAEDQPPGPDRGPGENGR